MEHPILKKLYKPALCLFAVAALAQNTIAETQIKVNIDAKADIHTNHWGVKAGGLKCGGGSNGTYVNSTHKYETSSNLQNKVGEKKTIDLSIASKRSGRGAEMFGLKVNSSVVQKKETLTLNVGIEDRQTAQRSYFWKSGCDHNHMQENLKNASFSGEAEFHYTVPAGVWAVKVTETDFNTLFSVSARQALSGILYETYKLPNKVSRQRTVWASPGSTIVQKFVISSDANDVTGNQTYEIRFQPYAPKMAFNNNTKIWLKQFGNLVRSLKEVATGERTSAADKLAKDIDSFLIQGLGLLRILPEFKEVMKGLSTGKLDAISNYLYEITRSQYAQVNTEQEQNIKTLAALLSYEVANLFVEELEPYCTTTEVYLEGLRKKVKVPGIRYAMFLMDRMKSQVDNEAIALHAEFLGELRSLQNEGYTYSGIFSVKGLPEKLRHSFKTVRELAQPQRRPYAEAFQDLSDFYGQFRSVGSDGASTADVINGLAELADLEYDYVQNLFRHIRLYNPDNDNKIDVNQLVTSLEQLQKSKDQVVSIMRNNMRFLTFETKAGSSSIGTMLTRLRTHNLNIIRHSYSDVEWDFDFENIRKAYVQAPRVEKNVSTIKQCLIGEE